MIAIKLYKHFHFPLNVFAHGLNLEYGTIRYLHYGLFEQNQNDDDLIKAQEASTRLLFSKLPKSRPCRVLEVGIGTGTCLVELIRSGYEVVGITPDEAQITYAKSIHEENLPIVLKSLEEYTDPKKFDIIIFQES